MATNPEPMRALWAMLPTEGKAILLDYAKQAQRLKCPHLTYDEVPCCSCLICEAQELAAWHARVGYHWHKRNDEACKSDPLGAELSRLSREAHSPNNGDRPC